MNSGTQLPSRRAIEALRSGVPNRDAVQALGSSQPDIERRFREQLKAVADGSAQGLGSEGMLIDGTFGSGKSHLLEYMQHVALKSNFVCSKVVVSKETPLYDPAKLFRAAIESAKVPDRTGNALTEIVSTLDFNSPRYDEFYQWVNRADNGLSRRFPATTLVFKLSKGIGGPEIADRIIQFWSGNKIATGDLRQWLIELGEAASYRIDKASVKELALQRYQFVPRLIVAAGYAGWVILVDEVELIGGYSWRQRANSYAEIGKLLGKLEGSSIPGVACVLAITDVFRADVLDARNDEEEIPNKLRATGNEADQLVASRTERGMRAIRREAMHLQPPSDDTFRDLYAKVKMLHGQAYLWDPPGEFAPPAPNERVRVRLNLKRWIHEWDLKRLYPGYLPHIEVIELKEDLSEHAEMEKPTETSEESGEDRAHE